MKEKKMITKAVKLDLSSCTEFEKNYNGLNGFIKNKNDDLNKLANDFIIEHIIAYREIDSIGKDEIEEAVSALKEASKNKDEKSIDALKAKVEALRSEFSSLKREATNAFNRSLYKLGRERCPDVESTMIEQVRMASSKEFKSFKKKADSRVPSFKSGSSCIFLHNKKYKIVKIDGNFAHIRVSLGSSKSEIKTLNFKCKMDGYQKPIVERMMSGKYKQGQAKIDISKKTKKVSRLDENGKSVKENVKIINLILSFSFEPEDNKLNPEIVAGIDLGISNPVVIAFNNSWHRLYYPQGHIFENKNRIAAQKRSYLNNNKKVMHNREGHGVKRKLKPIDRFREIESNFNSTENHAIARAVVEYCLENNCGSIVLEDLRNFNLTGKKWLGSWTYRDLQSKIAQKAIENGIAVYFAPPYNTSKTCSMCNHLNEHFTFNYRKQNGMPSLKCKSCNKEINADYNASRNLSKMPLKDLLTFEEWSKGKYKKKITNASEKVLKNSKVKKSPIDQKETEFA